MKRTRNGILIPDVPIMAGGNLPNVVKGVSAGVGDNPLLEPFYVDVLTTLHINNDLEISDDAKNWQPCGNRVLSAGRYYLRGEHSSNAISVGFSSYEDVNIGGNIMSLISHEFLNASLYEDCFSGLFNTTRVKDASALLLPSTTVKGCYQNIFYACSVLTAAPVLPATTLAEKCYYSMFRNCGSLTVAPVLPASTLAVSCYDWMFHSCLLLANVTCYAETFAQNSTFNWLYGTAATGTFTKKRGVTWESGTNGIPSDWNVVEVD